MKNQRTLKTYESNAETVPFPSPLPSMTMPQDPRLEFAGEAIGLVKESMQCFTDYLKCREAEVTERKKIQATLAMVSEKIQAQKESFMKQLEFDYGERKLLYDKTDAVIQHALAMNDMDMVKFTYNYILTIHNKSENTVNQSMQYLNNQNVVGFLK